MKHTVNVTLSLSPVLVARLHRCLPKGKISRFTTDALNKALDEMQQQKDGDLERAYAKAFSDTDRKLESVEWNECDENIIENWDWYEE